MRTRKTVLILISGKAQAGKTTVKSILADKLGKLESIETYLYSFAQPLKYMAKAFLGWDGEKDDAGRKLLQDIGRVGRDYDIDIWCKHLINQLDKSKNMFPYNFIIVDDWRFPNELEFFKKNPLFDIVTMRIWGRGGLDGETANDTSETSLPEAWAVGLKPNSQEPFYDFVVENKEDNLESLEMKLDEVLASIEKQYIV